MIKKLLNIILGDQNKKALKRIQPLVEKIKEFEKEYRPTIKDQNDVLAKTSEFKSRLKEGETLEDILPEAFALVKIACEHLLDKKWLVTGKEVAWNIVPFDVQLIGGIVLHQGNIAEMRTGEGKTFVCTMPVYLNALSEKGVFVVTVNEYLARRDSEWMGGLYNYLGLSVGTVIPGMNHEEKKQAYSCDVIYGTNNEFGFDYLRDNMATREDQIVQRDLNYAIIDEVDSILIDEARTPLIISAPAADSAQKYEQYSRLVNQLVENTDYDIDEKQKTATLTEAGIARMEQLLGIDNIYTEGGFTEVHHIEQALRAKACYKKDTDYIIQDGEVIIIDEFTGRLMGGRRYGRGLHQAIEAKEGVEIKKESKTLATISFQNYFRLFNKLAGMTGTAETEAEEFYQIYGLDTIVIPTNKPITREDRSDLIYKNQKGKYLAIAKKIQEINKSGRPVLVGTISVEQSEILSRLLQMEGINHEVLNAKQHAREAEIIAKAGQKRGVTIATNMAGRGTDIKLGEGVKELGGLYVIGSERHESRRIDNQLRGRSGRQGDPGTTQFYISMEDDLMRKFGGDRVRKMMEILKVPDDMPIETGIISRSIEGAQKKVEGHNFDIRKHLVEYDDVMNIQRNIIYKRRREILVKENLSEEIQTLIKETVETIAQKHFSPETGLDYKEIAQALNAIHHGLPDINGKSTEEIMNITTAHFTKLLAEREESIQNEGVMRKIEKSIYLRTTDILWMDHIDNLSKLRETVAFSGYAQKNPLNEYKSLAYESFSELLAAIRTNTVNSLFKVDLSRVIELSANRGPDLSKTTTNKSETPNPVVVKPSQAVRRVQKYK